eukprot:7591375-Karenia_brevis.AAC.1
MVWSALLTLLLNSFSVVFRLASMQGLEEWKPLLPSMTLPSNNYRLHKWRRKGHCPAFVHNLLWMLVLLPM